MANISRRFGTAVFSVSLLGLVGCGIQPTGVVDAGEPATGIAAGPRLYFLHSTSLQPIQQATGKLGTLQAALDALAAGPTTAERDRGLTTLLSHSTLRLDNSGGSYLVTVTGNPSPLPSIGMGQIVCTVAAWRSAAHGNHLFDTRVSIAESQHRYGPYSCDNFLY